MNDNDFKIEESFEISGVDNICSYFTQDKRGINFTVEYKKVNYFSNHWSAITLTTSSFGFNTSSGQNAVLITCSSIMPLTASMPFNTYRNTGSIHSYKSEISGLFLSKKIFGSFIESDDQIIKTISKINLEFLTEDGTKELAEIEASESLIKIKCEMGKNY